MKKFRILTIIVLLISVSLLFAGCGKDAGGGAVSEAPSDPRADFINGAKEFLSTDFVELLTGEEDGERFIGMLSDMLYDLNSGTSQADIAVTLTDVSIGEDALDGDISVSLGTLHDASTGDSSVEVSIGLGTEAWRNVGVYITGNTAVLKPGSTSEKIMIYTMPSVEGAGNDLLDKTTILTSGLLSDDGTAVTSEQNRAERQELCSRYLDQWLTDTAQEDYTDSMVTKTLAGKEVELRAITLGMEGQRAYDFVLKYMTALQADEQFADMDIAMGGLMSFLSTDLYDMITSAFEEEGGESIDLINSAVDELVAELQSLSPEEIAAAKFIATIYFDADKAIGIDIEASSTDMAFLLGGIIYRSGLEHEFGMDYQSVGGETAEVNLSTISAGGDIFDVVGNINVTNADGLEIYNGGYTATLTETDSLYDLSGNLSLIVQYFNEEEGQTQSGTVGGDFLVNIAHDDAGYTGTASAGLEMDAGQDATVSANILLDASVLLKDSVTVTPPMYTSSNVATVSNKADLWAIHQTDLGNMEDYSSSMQTLKLLMAFVLG